MYRCDIYLQRSEKGRAAAIQHATSLLRADAGKNVADAKEALSEFNVALAAMRADDPHRQRVVVLIGMTKEFIAAHGGK
jgi:hypothetical protein